MSHPFKDAKRYLALLLLLFLHLPLYGVEANQLQTRSEQLNEIRNNINSVTEKRKELQNTLKKLTDPEEIEEVSEHIEQLTTQRRDFIALFEQTSLGGIDTSRFVAIKKEDEATQTYNWQQELIQIVQPLFNEMRRMTDKARKRDQLREEKQELEELLSLAYEGFNHLEALPEEALEPQSLEAVLILKEDWQERIATLERQEQIIRLKLQDLSGNEHILIKLKNNTLLFLKGRGLTLLTALLASTLFYYLFSTIATRFISIYEEKRQRAISFKWRLSLLIYHALVAILTLATFLLTLHSFGDTVLFGLSILILLTLLLSFSKVLPSYVQKLRIFLNLGRARESERLIYNGIPWEVESIHLYSVYLINPALDNGRIRITIDQLDTLTSRPLRMDELWFPTRPGDLILMPDRRLMTVIRQTPEAVYLNHEGATLVMPTPEFYNLKFKNLSQGYSITASITLQVPLDHPVTALSHDPEDRSEILPDNLSCSVPEILHHLEHEVRAYFETYYPEISEGIRSVTATLQKITDQKSSNYQITLRMAQHSAKYYSKLLNHLQISLAHIATEHHWNLSVSEIL